MNPEKPQPSSPRAVAAATTSACSPSSSVHAERSPSDEQGASSPQFSPEFDSALQLVLKVKQQFADAPDTYQEFLSILNMHSKEQQPTRQVLEQMTRLFRGHPELLREFTSFLPDEAAEQREELLGKL